MLRQLDEVLSLFGREHPELSVPDVAARLRWPRSTTYRLMAQIERAGFLDRDEETGRYRLGIRLAALGELAQSATSLQRITQPVLRRLSIETGETATLLVLTEGEGYAVLHSESTHRVVAKGVLGRHWPLHASAGGKTLLAWCPEEQQRQLLKKPLKRYTETTIASLPAMHRELRQIRERGYATVRGEYMDDVWGVAAPIFNHRNELEGALTLGGPRSRVTRARFAELGEILVVATEGVSRAMGYQGPYPRPSISGSPIHEMSPNGRPDARSSTGARKRRSPAGSGARGRR